MIIIEKGEIRIPLEDFWGFVLNRKEHEALRGLETAFGVPRVDKEQQDIVISFAASSESNPSDWEEKPEFMNEWKITED